MSLSLSTKWEVIQVKKTIPVEPRFAAKVILISLQYYTSTYLQNVAQIAFNIEQVTTEGGMAVPAFNIQQGESEEEADESTIM